MFKSIQGTIQDSAADLQMKERQSTNLPHGEQLTLAVTVLDSLGVKKNLTGATLRFRLVHPVGGFLVTQSASTSGSKDNAGYREMTISLNQPVGSYHWDLWHEIGGVLSQIVPLSPFNIIQTGR